MEIPTGLLLFLVLAGKGKLIAGTNRLNILPRHRSSNEAIIIGFLVSTFPAHGAAFRTDLFLERAADETKKQVRAPYLSHAAFSNFRYT